VHYKSQKKIKTPRKTQKSTNVKSLAKKCYFSSFRNLTGSATVRMWSGRAFQVAGPACENAHSPKFVRSRGGEQSIDEVEDERISQLLTVRPSRFTGQLETQQAMSVVLTTLSGRNPRL